VTTTGEVEAATEDGGGLLAELKALVGGAGKPTVARHAVNEPMIAHWCDAMGEGNPLYTDEAYAARSSHGGIVAPPAMLDVWDRGGLAFAREPDSPRTVALNALFARGFDSIVAVNTELEFARYVRPGERLSNAEILDDISAEKHTARGPGHFVTTRHRYVNEVGEHVGDLLFRILVFRPEARAGEEAASASGGRPAPDPSPALRPAPAINHDNRYFWEGAAKRELRIQRCQGCGQLLAPPGPRCPRCGSFDMGWIVASGRGRLYSFAIPEHPKVPGFSYPLTVGLIELEEGTRLVSNVVGLQPEQLTIGMPLELSWLQAGEQVLPQFRAPLPTRREDTPPAGEWKVGQQLPTCAIPITATLVVAGALATRDFTPVHHDAAVAKREGSTDIFLNINTTAGLVQRAVSDWLGPEAVFRAIRIRLGAPGYPGDLLTFSGHVSSVNEATGELTVSLEATDSYGDHAIVTAEMTLPVRSAV
jgi:uncharacterized OB-fold protein/acyl dehydratase